MTKIVTGLFVLSVFGSGLVAVSACHTDETQPVVMPMNSAPVPGTYPPPGNPAATGTVPPVATVPPGTPTSAPASGLAVPGPMAFPCTTDAQCGLHRCNTQYAKCAFPCASDIDCAAGSSCVGAGQPVATCIPKLGGP